MTVQFPVGNVHTSHPHAMPETMPNMGEHRVKDITDEVFDIADKAGRNLSNLNRDWDSMGDTEQVSYVTAAICLIVALIIFFLALFFGGGMVLGALIPQLGSTIGFGLGALSLARFKTSEREPWQMPPISEDLKGNAEAERTWKALWLARNQAKSSYENVVQRLESRQKTGLEVSREEALARDYLTKYENAEVRFWSLADDEVAAEKIEEFNAAREARGEAERFPED
jgi:hypothetical protein